MFPPLLLDRLMSLDTILCLPDFAESVLNVYLRTGYSETDRAELGAVLSRRSGWPRGWMRDLREVGALA